MTKSAEELEREVERTRSRLDQDVDALSEKMTPGQLLDELMRGFRGSGRSGTLAGVGRHIREQPLPVALVGVGLVWVGAGLVWLAMGAGRDRAPAYLEYDDYADYSGNGQPGEDRYSAAPRPPGDSGGLP